MQTDTTNPVDISNYTPDQKMAFQNKLDSGLSNPVAANSQIVTPTTALNSSNLGGSTPINIPDIKPNTTAAGITGTTPAILEQQKLNAQIAADKAAQEAKLNSSRSTLDNAVGDVTTLQTNRATAEGDVNTLGTPAWLKEQARGYANSLDRSQRAQLNETAALDTQNLTDAGRQSASQAINHKYALEQADLQLKYHIAQGDYTAAEDTLNKKFELDLAPLKTKLDYQTNIYNDIKSSLTKAEDRQWNTLIDQSKTAVANVQKNQDTVGEWVKQAISSNRTDLIPSLVKINPSSPTFLQDLGKIQGQFGTNTASPSFVTDYSGLISSRTPEQAANFDKIPEADKSVVAQLISGDALLSDIVKSKGPAGTNDIKRYVNEATAIDPTFSINNNKVRFEFLRKWNDPNAKSSIMRNSINTSLGHLADFKTNADALNSSAIRKLNSVKNILSTETGDPAVLKIRTDIGALASEIATIYKNGVSPSETEIQDWRNTLAADFSKSQFQGVADEVAKLLSSKITATRYQYKSTMGFEYGQSLIDPDKRQALLDAGIAPQSLVKESIPNQAGGKIIVTDPNGGQHSFTDQASADKFKKAAGIK